MRISKVVVPFATIVSLAAGSVPAAVAAPEVPAGAAPRAAYVPEPIVWGPCEEADFSEAGLECGSFEVPVDWSRPDGEQLTLQVSRLPHRGERYQGVVITNPGGPGGAGRGLATLGYALPQEVGDSYDWIGLDPRGVAESSPALSCQPEPDTRVFPPQKPRTRADYNFYVQYDADYNADCAENSPASLLPHMRTIDVARDIDALRVALGQQQITFYGFSYGSYIGQVYATLFPTRVRRMVLDGVLDPDRVWYGRARDIMPAFQRNTDLFFRWMAQHDDVYDAGSTLREVRQRFFRLQDELYADPADGTVGGTELLASTFNVSYGVFLWPDVAEAYSALLNEGDASGVEEILRQAQEGADNGAAVYYATTCTDTKWPNKVATYDRAARRGERSIPEIAWQTMWGSMRGCRTWPAPDRYRVQVARGAGTPKALLLSETLDAPTPYSGALTNRRLWPGSRLVGSTGSSHAVSLFGVPCSDDRVIAYLDTGELPARKRGDRADVSCPGLPAPDPSSGEDMRRLEARDAMPDLAREALLDAQRVEQGGLLR